EQKVRFARKRQLSGVMVWAVSQDTPDAVFSKALGNYANTRPRPQAPPVSLPMETVQKEQTCRWTGCLENCRSDEYWVERDDPDRNSNGEKMMDASGCGFWQQQEYLDWAKKGKPKNVGLGGSV